MSNFVGTVNKDFANYVVIKRTGSAGSEIVYTLTDDTKNILIWQTEKVIEKSDGNHYFLVEGKVKEHVLVKNVKQTILTGCEWELIGRHDDIAGDFYGKPGDIIELDNVKAVYRKVSGSEWLINGGFAFKPPVSDYTLVIEHKFYTFLVPYDSKKEFDIEDSGKFNINGKIIGYMIKNKAKASFIYPTAVEDKNGPFYSGMAGSHHWGAGMSIIKKGK